VVQQGGQVAQFSAYGNSHTLRALQGEQAADVLGQLDSCQGTH
jgi:hypothetical protein